MKGTQHLKKVHRRTASSRGCRHCRPFISARSRGFVGLGSRPLPNVKKALEPSAPLKQLG